MDKFTFGWFIYFISICFGFFVAGMLGGLMGWVIAGIMVANMLGVIISLS